MHQTLLVVVLRGKTYRDALTLNCLMDKAYKESDLVIINIGPVSLRFDKDFIHTLGFYFKSIDIRECLDGRPISNFYNDILKAYHDIERFIFLDDDSILNKRYLKNLNRFHKDGIDLQIPMIRAKSDGEIYYPVVDESVENVFDGLVINATQHVHSPGFCLVIYRSLINKFYLIQEPIFDDHFSLNDVDYNFFERFKLLREDDLDVRIQVVNTIEHALDCNKRIENKWRILARLKEGILPIKSHFTN